MNKFQKDPSYTQSNTIDSNKFTAKSYNLENTKTILYEVTAPVQPHPSQPKSKGVQN